MASGWSAGDRFAEIAANVARGVSAEAARQIEAVLRQIAENERLTLEEARRRVGTVSRYDGDAEMSFVDLTTSILWPVRVVWGTRATATGIEWFVETQRAPPGATRLVFNAETNRTEWR